jgi:hypothetical protein
MEANHRSRLLPDEAIKLLEQSRQVVCAVRRSGTLQRIKENRPMKGGFRVPQRVDRKPARVPSKN